MNKMFLKLKYNVVTPEEAYRYCVDHGRIPDLEECIVKDPEWAYYYARDVIKGRWSQAEPHIMKDPEWAYYYARDVIKGRWSQAKPYSMKNDY